MAISRAQMRTQMKGNPVKKPTKKTPTKKSMYDLSPEGKKGFDKADRNKMKNYGDTPDPRPRTRVVTPDTLGTIKSLKSSPKKLARGGKVGRGDGCCMAGKTKGSAR